MRPVACEPLCRRVGVVGRVGQPRRGMRGAGGRRGAAGARGCQLRARKAQFARPTAPVAADGVARTPPATSIWTCVTNLEQIISVGNLACSLDLPDATHRKSMLRAASRLAGRARSAAPRRGIASGTNLLELSTSDLQPARTWDSAEADGVCAASGGAASPPSPLFSVE